jgi:hypothetical protein
MPFAYHEQCMHSSTYNSHLQKKKAFAFAFAFASCMEQGGVLGAGRRVVSSTGTTQREATATSSPSWPRRTEASTDGGPGGVGSLVGAGGAASMGDDLVRAAPCCAIRAAPSRITMNLDGRRPRPCCAEPRHRGRAVLRQAPSRGIRDLPHEYTVCPASRFPPPILWPLLHPCAWPCCCAVHFIASPGSTGQWQAASVGERGRWHGAGASEGDDLSGGLKQACNFASDERGQSILALILHRCFASSVGEEFENAQWHRRCIFAFALFY